MNLRSSKSENLRGKREAPRKPSPKEEQEEVFPQKEGGLSYFFVQIHKIFGVILNILKEIQKVQL